MVFCKCLCFGRLTFSQNFPISIMIWPIHGRFFLLDSLPALSGVLPNYDLQSTRCPLAADWTRTPDLCLFASCNRMQLDFRHAKGRDLSRTIIQWDGTWNKVTIATSRFLSTLRVLEYVGIWFRQMEKPRKDFAKGFCMSSFSGRHFLGLSRYLCDRSQYIETTHR